MFENVRLDRAHRCAEPGGAKQRQRIVVSDERFFQRGERRSAEFFRRHAFAFRCWFSRPALARAGYDVIVQHSITFSRSTFIFTKHANWLRSDNVSLSPPTERTCHE